MRGRALGEFAGDVRACADSLAQRAAATEPGFLALGGDLQTLHRSATELTQMVEESIEGLREKLTAQRIAGADGVVAGALQAVQDGVASVGTLLEQSREITDGLRSLKPQLEAVGRIGVLLQSVAVGFAVESSRTAECQAAFGSFVDEIRGLSRRTNDVEAKISDELSGACATEGAALEELETELGELQDLARQLAETSSRAASEVQTMLNEIVAALAAMRDRSRLIQQQTEDAVFHMQFGDIVRQKIEHVGESLVGAAEKTSRAGARDRAAVLAVAQLLAVQIAQIETVEDELATAERHLGTSFTRIGEAAAGLMKPAGGEGARASGVLELRDLLVDLGRLQALLTRAGQLQARAFASGKQAFATAERIAGQMREVQAINREMHLLALNAIVKTAALGSAGATLEVLSMQVHELYRQADVAVGTIGDQASRLGKNRKQVDAEDVARAALEQSFVAALEQVSRGAGDYEQTITRLGERLAGQDEHLRTAAARLAGLGEFAEQLRGLRGRLVERRAGLVDWCGFAAVELASAAAGAEHHYTMESEREIHRRIVAGGTAAASPAVKSAAAPRATAGGPVADSPGDPVKAGEARTDKDRSSAGAPAAGADSLGDNVELF